MRVSVITIARNCDQYIERTIRSVLAQRYKDIEYIIVDGASTDGTMEIVSAYKDRVAVVISEADKGISDAWNKGLTMATGDIIALLNAGDEHYPDTVSKAVEAIDAGADMTYGDTELVDDDGKVLMLNQGRFHLWLYSAGVGFYHPSCFATKALYDRVGGFDLKLRYAMDTDWIIRAAKAGAVIRHAGTMTRMVDGGVSVKNRFLAYGEHLQALHNSGLGPAIVYKSMLMTSLRGLASYFLKMKRG